MIQSPQDLKHHYRFSDFLYYVCLLLVPVITAFTAIIGLSTRGAVLYAVLGLGLIPVLLRFFCSRCPHYCRDEKTLKCIFFWGFPKFFTARPGRLTATERMISFGATAVFLLVPVYWLFKEPGLLIVYLLSLAGFGATIHRNECSRCIYVECPANSVPESVKISAGLP
ncbi:MAG: hypothetical protein V1793_23185 [Pseudomonadota bacterium]